MASTPKEITEKVLATRKAVKTLKHDETNPHGGYTYVSIDTYYEKIASVAAEQGLIWRTRETSFELVPNQGKEKNRTYVKASFAYDLMVGAAEALDYMAVTIISPIDGPQTTGQLFSYADKVFMRVAFCVSTGEKDADATRQEPIDISTKKGDDPLDLMSATSTVLKDSIGHPVQANNAPPVDSKGNPLEGDKVTGEILELPPYQAALAPKFKDGLPLVDTRKLDNEKAVTTIIEIFKVFVPHIQTKAKITDYHAENLAAIEKAEKLVPGSKATIGAIFRAQVDKVTKK